MSAILVTGGAGFIGSHVCKALAAAGKKVVVVDNLTEGNRPAVKWGDLVVGNLSDGALLERTLRDYAVDAVIHMAASAYVRESVRYPDRYWENNVLETAALLQAMAETGVSKIVFSSSCASYGVPARVPIAVDSVQNPVNPYGRTKLACEWMIQDYAAQYDWQHAILRYFNVAGSDPDLEIGEFHEPETHIIPIILGKALSEKPEPVRVFGADHPTEDGTCVRDYIHVSDLAAVHARALDYIESEQEAAVFNVGLGQGTSILELIKVCEEVTGRGIPYRMEDANPGDPPTLVADPGDVWRELGLEPRFPRIETMVEHAWRWMSTGIPSWRGSEMNRKTMPSSFSERTHQTLQQEIRVTVSGRLCLFGEHSDWAADYGLHPGMCIIVGTDQQLCATAALSEQLSVSTVIGGQTPVLGQRRRVMHCPWEADVLLQAAQDPTEFFRYCAGVAHEVMAGYDIPLGIKVHITDVTLPVKRGLSSSAAVCVLMARAFNTLYGLGLSDRALMDLAYRGERLTGSRCGRMDQFCHYGKTAIVLTMAGGDQVRLNKLSCGDSISMFYVDLNGRKDTARILKDLQSHYADTPELQQALGPENERIVTLASKALTKGDARTLGFLMNQAQDVFDRLVAPHCPTELDSPALHELLRHEPLREYVYGGKGVGSQGDGTAQFVALDEYARVEAMKLIESSFPGMRCYPLTIESEHSQNASRDMRQSAKPYLTADTARDRVAS